MKKGKCPFCGKIIKIRNDGGMITVWPNSYILNGHKNQKGEPCKGSAKPPSEERVELICF